MTKTKDQTVRVKVNPAGPNGTDRDEVSIQSAKWEEPKEGEPAELYINRMVYAKPGTFKDGEFSETEVSKLEAESNDVLAKELASALKKEAKEREALEAKAVEAKAPAKKSEG